MLLCKTNKCMFVLFLHMRGVNYTVVCSFQCAIIQEQWNSLRKMLQELMVTLRVKQWFSNVPQPTLKNDSHLILFRWQISIIIWLLRVLQHLDYISSVTHYALHWVLYLTLHHQLRPGQVKTLFCIFLSINFHNKSKCSHHLLVIFNPIMDSTTFQKKNYWEGRLFNGKWTDACFFINTKVLSLICRDCMQGFYDYNLKRYYTQKHSTKVDVYKGFFHKDKMEEFLKMSIFSTAFKITLQID